MYTQYRHSMAIKIKACFMQHILITLWFMESSVCRVYCNMQSHAILPSPSSPVEYTVSHCRRGEGGGEVGGGRGVRERGREVGGE